MNNQPTFCLPIHSILIFTLAFICETLIWSELHPAEASVQKLNIVIDPGHGGKDLGAHRSHTKESELVLGISQKLKTLLSTHPRFNPLLTRESDHFLTLSERVQKAEQLKADLFLSIHMNWSLDPQAQGVEIYFQNQLPADEESMFLAARENHDGTKGMSTKSGSSKSELQLILDDLERNHRIFKSSELAKHLKESWRGRKKSKSKSIHQAPFFVISNLQVPSVLIELGFLSHPLESKLLQSPEYQEQMIQNIYNGVVKYYETMDKSPSQSLD